MTDVNRFPSSQHKPVLYQSILSLLNPHSPGQYVDGTVGTGGHAWGVLKLCSPNGQLLGLDVDPMALSLAQQHLSTYGQRAILLNASYTTIPQNIKHLGWSGANGILLDLGVSSMQLDNPLKGFSFSKEGPLDMRFDPEQGQSAHEVVNTLSEKELADVIWKYGEESNSRKIARAIVQSRPIQSTLELSKVIESASRGYRGKIHPATRTFQAIRIAVNNEINVIEAALPKMIGALKPEGRIAIISFHSLEDRVVKNYFRQESRDCICPPGQPICNCDHKASIKILTKKLIRPTEQDIMENPRARSARLRAAEKIQLA